MPTSAGVAGRREVLLTVQTDVMVGENDRSGALGNTPHSHMQHAMEGLNVMLLSTNHSTR